MNDNDDDGWDAWEIALILLFIIAGMYVGYYLGDLTRGILP